MAEGFARAYGSDVLSAGSAGLAPATAIPPLTYKVMQDKNIPLAGQFPKGLDTWAGSSFDLIANLSGRKLPSAIAAPVEDWDVRDPIGAEEEVYREVRDRIEGLVMRLVLAARTERERAAAPRRRRKFLRN